jgi:sulfur transfer protein SufE
MSDFSRYPDKLREVLEIFAENPGERNQMLIEYSDQFAGVPEHIATRPYPLANQVPHCESDSYVFVERLDGATPDGSPRLKFYFAVENPFGVSARALSAVLDATINGLSANEIAAMPIEDLVPTLYGKNISMGKGQGLLSIAAAVKKLAQRHATAASATANANA